MLSVLLSILMGWVLSRAIATPITAMTGAMDRLAGGDNTVEVPAQGRKDEVGRMAVAVQSFKDAAVTASDGTYTDGGLPAGSYQVLFGPNNGQGQNYVYQYYPDKSNAAAAQAVSVTAGQTTAHVILDSP